MKDINFSSIREHISKYMSYELDDSGLASEEDAFAEANRRVAKLRDLFSEVYFLEEENERIIYTQSTGREAVYEFSPREIKFSDEDLIEIRDFVYDRGGNPNKIVFGIYKIISLPDYENSDPSKRSKFDYITAGFFVKS